MYRSTQLEWPRAIRRCCVLLLARCGAFAPARSGVLALTLSVTVVLFANHAQAAASAHESHERIRAEATRHARADAELHAPPGAEVRIDAATLDPRLRLAACPTPLETFSPPGHRPGGNVTVGVRCMSGASWSLYVPVRVEMTASVLVLEVSAARGHVLSANDVGYAQRDISQLAGGYLTSPDEVAGMIVKRPAAPGSVLTTAMLERPKLFKRGDRVRVRAGNSIVAVDSEAEALADGAEGDRVRVRNLRSGAVIEGVVDSSGLVLAGR